MSGPRVPFASQSFTIDAKVSNPWKPRLAMSRTAAVRFSGVRGNAPQMSAVHPIFNFRDCATASDGNAAAPSPATTVFAKSRRFKICVTANSSRGLPAEALAEAGLLVYFNGQVRRLRQPVPRPVRLRSYGHARLARFVVPGRSLRVAAVAEAAGPRA